MNKSTKSVTFFIQWREFPLRITSKRRAVRDAWPFFFMQFNAEQFTEAPRTYFRALETNLQEKDALIQWLISDVWPHLSFIDTQELVSTIEDIVQRLIMVIRVLLRALLIFVWISILVCLEAMKTLKKQKTKIYSLMWATKKMLQTTLWTEIYVIFWWALAIAILSSSWALARSIIQSDFLNRSWWIARELWLIVLLIIACIYILIKRMYKHIV